MSNNINTVEIIALVVVLGLVFLGLIMIVKSLIFIIKSNYNRDKRRK